jgi:hypothetical protein
MLDRLRCVTALRGRVERTVDVRTLSGNDRIDRNVRRRHPDQSGIVMKKAHSAMAEPEPAFDTLYCLDLAVESTAEALDWISNALEAVRQNKRSYTPRTLVPGSRKQLLKSGDEFAQAGALLFERPKGFDAEPTIR